jgi:O-antigen ligase
MQISNRGDARLAALFRFSVVAAAMAVSFGAAVGAPYLFRVAPRVSQFLSSSHAMYLPLYLIAAFASVYFLLRYAEVTVAIFYLVGFFKGDPRLESTPVDLTLGLGVLMIAAMVLRLVFTEQTLKLPMTFLFYLPILFLMFFSLLYTPDFNAGLDKTLRFLFLTCFGAISPFLLVDTPVKIKRFFGGLIVGGVAMSINSLFMLGGGDRLIAPGGVPTALGLSAGLALTGIWTLYFPTMSLAQRALLYPVVGVLLIALVGSGARAANVGTVVSIGLALFFCRKLLIDLGLTLFFGLLTLPYIRIPDASFAYIASLARPHDAFGTRSDLMDLGLRTFIAHPLLGVGVQGYRFLSPNPTTYNFAHNLFLEMGSELGIFAVVAVLGLAACSLRVMFRLVRDVRSPDIVLRRAIFCVLVLPIVNICVAGDINNDRLAFFMFSMPFVLQAYASTHGAPQCRPQSRTLAV